jgi:CubicO group peptidase (beta-lactamase class C family)
VKAPDYATPHVKTPDGKVITTNWRNLDNIAPAGSVNSSARDMACWLTMQINGGTYQGQRIVDERQLKETHSPQMVIQDGAQSRELNPETSMNVYGLAWRLQDYRGTHMVSHGGAIDGFRAQVAFLPKEKLGVVVLTNLGGNNLPEALRFALFDQLLGLPEKDWKGLYLAASAKSEAEAKKRIADREAKRFKDTKPSRDLAVYAARYENPAYGALDITLNQGALHAAWGNTRLKLEHFHFDTFQGPPSSPGGMPAELVFRLDGRGGPASVVFLEQEFRRAAK